MRVIPNWSYVENISLEVEGDYQKLGADFLKIG